MKLGFVFQKDSHLRAVLATAFRLRKDYPQAKIQFFVIDAPSDSMQWLPDGVVFLSVENLTPMQDCDYLVCCLGGYLLNKVIGQYHQTQTKIIALFPGIVSHYQLDAFITRFNADQVWLNCPADVQFYTKLCQVFGVPNNGVLYGASWFLQKNNQSISDGSTIFFEQTQIINNQATAQKIELQLIGLIKKNPNIPFIYKLRENIHNEYLVTMREHLAQFANVQMVSVLNDSDVQKADTFLSISSSAIVEGLLLGKQCYLLDKAYLDDDAREFFGQSNLFLSGNLSPNPNWLTDRVFAPVSTVILETISKQSPKKFHQRSLIVVVVKMVLLAWRYPKLFFLFGKSDRIRTIKKSLEYL